MSETEEENDLMSEFRKLQTETTGIRSLFSDKSSIDVVGLTGNKLAKDIHDFCEKTIVLQDKFNKKVSDELKNQKEIILKNYAHQDESMKKMAENIEVIEKNQTESVRILLGELEAIRKEMNGAKLKCEIGDDCKSELKSSPEDSSKQKMRNYVKEFELKHVFKNVLELESGVHVFSEKEEFFDVSWLIYIFRNDNSIAVFLECCKSLEDDEWSICLERNLRVISPAGEHLTRNFNSFYGNINNGAKFSAYGSSNFLSWDKMKSDYLVDGNLTVEAHVKINKMTGVYKKSSRSFDETMKDYSDTVLIVQNKKFRVFRLLLIAQSSYFKTLLSDCIKGSEINVPDVDSEDFLVFLAVIYGDPLDESTVEVILMLSEQFEAENVIKRCEEFLLNKSKKSLKKKLQLALRYGLEKLKNKCISEIKSVEDIESVNPEYLHEYDPSITLKLLERALSFK